MTNKPETEMVERCARVIYPAAFADYERRYAYEMSVSGDAAEAKSFADMYDARGSAFQTARAVLEALREPTPEMVVTAISPYRHDNTEQFNDAFRFAVVEYWYAMIDAALSTKQEEGR